MTPEGDCPDCKTELVQEEKVEVVVKTDFTKFKESVKTALKLKKENISINYSMIINFPQPNAKSTAEIVQFMLVSH